MRRSRHAAVAGLLLLGVVSSPGWAQGTALVGGHAVRLAGSDTLPLAGAMVVLHQLGSMVQGPIDSVSASATGRFRFRAAVDSTAVLLVTTRYSGIEYTSRPMRLVSSAPDTTLLVVAADTASGAPVSIGARFLVLNRPGQGGVRGVLDLIVLQNRGGVTRVAPGAERPSFAMPLPAGLTDFHVEDGEISPAAVSLARDTLVITSPFPPGERQLIVTYTLPGGRARYMVPFDLGADSVVVLLEEAGARVASPGFVVADSARIEGRTYRRWVATGLAPGPVEIRVPAGGQVGRHVTLALAAFVGAVLVAALVWLRAGQRRGTVAMPVPPATPAMLIEQLAHLDAQFADRESQVTADEWARYQVRRAGLLAAYAEARQRRP